MISTVLAGAVTGASLIVAIGAQNVFVLTKAIKDDRPYIVATTCSLCDTILIFIGTITMGNIVATNPMAKDIATIAGTLFLLIYGGQSLYSAVKNNYMLNGKNSGDAISAGFISTIFVTLGITLLNPHVYLDTVLLLGSLAGQQGTVGKYYFAFGASLFSWLWFFLLVIGGKKLACLFDNSQAWRILDIFVCITMWTIAANLLSN